jgi:hypothetical protein
MLILFIFWIGSKPLWLSIFCAWITLFTHKSPTCLWVSPKRVSIIVGELFWVFEQLMLDCLIRLHVVLHRICFCLFNVWPFFWWLLGMIRPPKNLLVEYLFPFLTKSCLLTTNQLIVTIFVLPNYGTCKLFCSCLFRVLAKLLYVFP